MQVGAISSQPYIYNTNQVDATSMNRVPPITNDINAEKTDYSNLVGNQENTNSLRPGESASFSDIINEQMSRSEQNAARIMRDEAAAAQDTQETVAANAQPQGNAVAEANPREVRVDEAVQASVAPAMNDDVTTQAASQVNTAAAETVARPEPEPREPYGAVTREEERMAAPTANDQNVPGTVTATITEDGAVSAYSSQDQASQVENFQLGTSNPTGNDLTGGTAFENVIPEALGPYSNAAVDYAEARAAESTVADQLMAQAQEQENNPINLFQMQRATNAYAMAMGL